MFLLSDYRVVLVQIISQWLSEGLTVLCVHLLEEAVHVTHLHKHSLQLGVILYGYLSILPPNTWRM